MSHSIIRRHHGDITVASKIEGPEHGTTFTISLPAVKDSPAVRAATLPPQEHKNGRARILVVDD